MAEMLYITWKTGWMNIDMDEFFPVSLAKFKKLLKIIDEDWQHCDELTDRLKTYFRDKEEECRKTAKEKANEYVNLDQRVRDLQRLVKERKKPSGVYLTAAEHEQAKTDLYKARTDAAQALSSHKVNSANVKKYHRLLEEINKR